MDRALQPGDLIIVRTPRAGYALGRWLGGFRYDHIGVVVTGGRTLNVVVPAAVFTPIERLLTDDREPVVLRPRFEAEARRDAFVQELEALAGVRYDLGRALSLILRVLLRSRFGLRWRLGHPDPRATRWTCTDAVFTALERHAFGAGAVRALPLEWTELGCASADDFLRLSSLRPDLLEVVAHRQV